MRALTRKMNDTIRRLQNLMAHGLLTINALHSYNFLLDVHPLRLNRSQMKLGSVRQFQYTFCG
jgi:hypothetical protein